MPRRLTSRAFAEDAITADALSDGAIEYHHCSWYSPNVFTKHGAIQLPRGTSSERPTVVQGGREVATFDLTVSSPNLEEGDPGFVENDPWLWSWAANYNRTNPATNVAGSDSTVTNLTLFRGSTYTFRNFTVGHNLWLRHTEKINAGDPDNVNAVTGATNNGAIRTVGSTDPGVVTWTIPLDYAYDRVVIQHKQTGMANTINVADAPAETLGYIRLNTELGSDDTTGVGLEYYTGQGWVEVGSQPDFQILEHPTGSLTYEDWNTASGSEDWNTATGTEDWGGAIVSAFLGDGNLSVNDDYAVVAHDGSTGGGIPMLRADMSNLSVDLVNTKYNFLRAGSQTLTDCDVAGSATSRIAFGTAVETGISNILLEDSNKVIRINKDVTNAFFKFEMKVKPSVDCTFEVWKNGSKLSYADYVLDNAFHATVSWIESASFDDTFEFRLYGASSISITNTDTLLIEFIGS